MKKFIVFTLYIFFSFQLIAQNTFFTKYPTYQTDRTFDAVQASDGSFIIVGKRSTTIYEEDVCGLVMKTDENGNLLKEMTLANKNRTYFYIIDKIPNFDNEFIVFGSVDSISGADLHSSIIISHIDINLNILSQHRTHSIKNFRILPWKHTYLDDTTLILQSGCIAISTPATTNIIVSKFKLPADSLTSFVADPGIISVPGDIIYLPGSNEIHSVYFGGILDDTSAIKILRLDDELNKIETLQSPSRAFSTPCTAKLTDSSYLLTSSSLVSYGSSTMENVTSFIMDKYGNGLNGTKYYNHPDTILYAGFGTNTTILNNSIFITGLYNIDPWEIPWQNTPTWVQITKLDMELNILNHHFYGGDAMYIPYCIIPTIDDGVFITGIMWDYNIPNSQQHDIFALKLNSDGQIVNIPEDATWQAAEAIVYPNPARDILNIEFSMLYKKATFSLTDISGKTALVKQLTTNRLSINISAIPAGTYVYRIFNKDGLDERGKIVVE